MDWVRLHAALNDLPAALLLAAVLFDVLGAVNKRASLSAAGFWCLFAGVIGGALAATAGEMAESVAEHTETAHAIMETHEKFAWVVLGLFTVLALWRLVRRVLGKQEQTAFTTAGVIGVALLVYTAKLGGRLVFDNATGIRNETLEHVIEERQGGHHHHEGEEEDLRAPDSTHAHADTAEHHH